MSERIDIEEFDDDEEDGPLCQGCGEELTRYEAESGDYCTDCDENDEGDGLIRI